jgi:hypothetical protein
MKTEATTSVGDDPGELDPSFDFDNINESLDGICRPPPLTDQLFNPTEFD